MASVPQSVNNQSDNNTIVTISTRDTITIIGIVISNADRVSDHKSDFREEQ